MPAYHSAFNGVVTEELCGCPVLPLRTRVRGPAPCLEAPPEGYDSVAASDAADADIVDEALRLFRANMLFKNFDLLGGGDRLLIYTTLFIHACLKRVARGASILGKSEAARELIALAAGAHVAPGDAGWPLGGVIVAAKTPTEAEAFKGYLRQVRETVVARLVSLAWDVSGSPNKHWMAYGKRKGFM